MPFWNILPLIYRDYQKQTRLNLTKIKIISFSSIFITESDTQKADTQEEEIGVTKLFL